MLTLEWIGKNKVVNHHQEVPFRVLERQYSFDEQGQHTENNDSENMIIHGDNLEALKALLPQYEGKVKCIYIVILTPILMSILSSENAVRLNFIIHIMFLALFEMRNYNVLCGVVCSKRLLNQAVGKSLRTHNLKPKKGAQVMRKNEKITALYERLSRDDFGKDDDQQRESNSISNQKAMLEEFAARQGFTNIVHFTDDGICRVCEA